MKIYFLWTGGWDSTFRIIQLYNQNLTIQPIYIIDPSRKSNKKEIETINLLSELIPSKFENSKGKILPLELINRNDIKKDYFVKIIFQLLRKFNKKKLGKQYYWIACLSRERKISLELCFHKENREMLIPLDEIMEIRDETGEINWIVNPKKMKFFKRQIFKNMRFPLMYISKVEMKDFAEKNNFLDIMNKTWFCHRSEKHPCGKCAPCKQYIIDGFEDRVKLK
jgi:7-cyano-7-deazaguanine synthase